MSKLMNLLLPRNVTCLTSQNVEMHFTHTHIKYYLFIIFLESASSKCLLYVMLCASKLFPRPHMLIFFFKKTLSISILKFYIFYFNFFLIIISLGPLLRPFSLQQALIIVQCFLYLVNPRYRLRQ